MNYRKVCSVGNSVLFLVYLGLSSCSNNDGPALGTPGLGGATGAATGGASNAGGTSAKSTNSEKGGATTATTTKPTGTGGKDTSTTDGGESQGGASNGGDSSTDAGADQGGSGNEGGASDAKGGTTAKSGTAKGGTSGTSKGGSTSAGGTGAGGSGAGGTSSGTDQGGTATGGPVAPEKVSDSDYKFSMPDCGNVVMDVNPAIGARVSKLTVGGKGVITPHTATTYDKNNANNNTGSTFWTSPQSAWPGGTWPPVPEIDGGTYTAKLDGTNLVATGPANSTLGISVTKDFSADGGTCWISLLYTMKASKAVKVAPWEITRVPRGGIAFFPQGPSSPVAGPLTIATTSSPNVVWFDDSAKSATSTGDTMIADGADGWFAYALGSILFIKKYTNIEKTDFAEAGKEGEIEIYPGDGYLELEVQGAYKSLAANGTLPWTVQWKAVAIPSSVTVAAKNTGLFDFAKTEATK